MNIQQVLQILFPNGYEAWINLLRATGLLQQFPKEATPEIQLNTLNDLLQKYWIRAAGKERWQISDDTLSAEQKEDIQDAFISLRLYDERAPFRAGNYDGLKIYDCAFLLGATEARVRLRLDYLLKLWEQGVRFQRLYILAGYRKLSAEVEKDIMAKLQAAGIDLNETNMMEYVVSHRLQEQKIIPEGVIKVLFVNAPTQGDAPRATTTDNYTSWKEKFGLGCEGAKDKTILIVSNSPYCGYQGLTALQNFSSKFEVGYKVEGELENHFILENGYDLEIVGEAGTPNALTVGLDTLAREIYTSLAMLKSRLEASLLKNNVVLEEELSMGSLSMSQVIPFEGSRDKELRRSQGDPQSPTVCLFGYAGSLIKSAEQRKQHESLEKISGDQRLKEAAPDAIFPFEEEAGASQDSEEGKDQDNSKNSLFKSGAAWK